MLCHVIFSDACFLFEWRLWRKENPLKQFSQVSSIDWLWRDVTAAWRDYRLGTAASYRSATRTVWSNPRQLYPGPKPDFWKGGGEFSRIHEHNIPWGGYCDKDCPQKENFKQMFANSTVLMLQKWRPPKFSRILLLTHSRVQINILLPSLHPRLPLG